jgi:transcription-repair coupling factor (superfamily II helicase)
LPPSYVAKEESRLEAYRRLAAVTTDAEVDDIRTEWLDRYGPIPPQAEALLEVAGLRVECVRTGVREVTVTKGPGFGGPRYIARLTPVELPTSKVIRLRRLYKDTVYKEDLRHLQLPVASAGDAASTIVAALRELIPDEEA